MSLREEVARALEPCLERAHNEYQLADAAIAIVERDVFERGRVAGLEEAAKEAEKFSRMMNVEPYADAPKLVAWSIRALAATGDDDGSA